MKKTFILLLTLTWLQMSYSQDISPQIVSTAGTTFQGNAMQLDWTLGELMIETSSNSTNLLSQGFHQTYYLISSIDKLSSEIGEINVFPNPTQDWMNVSLSFDEARNVEMFLYDPNGRLIFSKQEKGSAFTLNTSIKELPAGTYFLSFIIDNNRFKQSFKIQKIY